MSDFFKNVGGGLKALFLICAPFALFFRHCDDFAPLGGKVIDTSSGFRNTGDISNFRRTDSAFPTSFDSDLAKLGVEPEELGKLIQPYDEPDPAFTRIRTVSVIPGRSSFGRIFPGDELANSLENEFVELNDAFSRINRSTVLSENAGLDELERLGTESGAGELVILVGHSEQADGQRIFRFGNGKEYTLQELHETSREKGFHLMVLTCRSPDFSVGRNISYREALKIIEEVQFFMKEPRTKSDLIRIVRLHLFLADAKIGAAYVAPVGGVAIYHITKPETNK